MPEAAGSSRPATSADRDVWNWGSRVLGVAGILVAAVGLACSDTAVHVAGSDAARLPHVRLNPHRGEADTPAVDVVGLPADALSRLREAALTPEEWTGWLRISVAGGGENVWEYPAVLGSYDVSDDAIHFSPLFDFEPGRSYRVVFDPARLPVRLDGVTGAWRSHSVEETVGEPASTRRPATTVADVYPTSDVVPENLLRLYISFSAPMGFRGGSEYVHLVDEDGRVVEDPFLPLDVALWNETRTRYTLLFDPGRVKRGILPHERTGRAIVAGRTYTLVVEREWSDALGLPLAESFSRRYTVGPPEHRALDTAEWQVSPPSAGTRDPLEVVLPRPLDYALLQRALLVATARGEVVDGHTEIGAAETRWRFTPRTPWGAREYQVVARSVLEDPAGNRVGRAFEIDSSERTSRGAGESGRSVTFLPTPPVASGASPVERTGPAG